jgi:hypothetical protein
MNDPQYQTGSSWALGGALRALGGALGSRHRRQKCAKNVPKIPPKRRCRRALYAKFPAPPLSSRASERVGFSARACEREVDTTAQRAESPVEVQEQRERERKRKRIGMGQVSAMCAHAPCSRAPACTPHTQRAHARRSRALPVPHQKLGPGGRKGLLVATGHGRRRRRSRSKQRSPLPADL